MEGPTFASALLLHVGAGFPGPLTISGAGSRFCTAARNRMSLRKTGLLVPSSAFAGVASELFQRRDDYGFAPDIRSHAADPDIRHAPA